MRLIILSVLLSAPVWGTSTVRTSVQTGNLSDPATWGGTAPLAGDYLVISTGTTVTADVSIVLGIVVGCSSPAVTINGTIGSPAILQVNNGVSLTLAGCSTTNGFLTITQYGQFIPLAGSTILFSPGAGTTSANNSGTVSAVGTALLPITFSLISTRYTWNNAYSHAFLGSVLSPWGPNVWQISLGNTWVSNAAGNAAGSTGNSSLSFTSLSGQFVGYFTNEVATVDAIANPGDFAVNYDRGVVFFYNTVTLGGSDSVTVTDKYLVLNRQWFLTAASTASFTCAYCVVQYGGSVITPAIAFGGGGSLTHSTLNWDSSGIDLNGVSGSVGSPVLIQGNHFNSPIAHLSGTTSSMLVSTSTAYVTIDSNVFNTNVAVQVVVNTDGGNSQTGMRITNNTGWVDALFYQDSYNGQGIAPGGLIQGNVLRGFTDTSGTTSTGNFRMISGFSGSSTNQSYIQNNVFSNNSQGISLSSYTTVQNNVLSWMTVEFIREAGLPGELAKNSIVRNNIFLGASVRAGNGMMTGSDTHPRDNENLEFSHNTFAADTVSGQGAWSFGYIEPDLIASLMVHDNIVYDLNAGSNREPSTSTARVTGGMARNDTNYYYGMASGNVYLGYNRGASVLFGGGFYALSATRAVTGVSLWNPLYSTPQSGGSLVLTVTSAIDKTLAWNGGTPVQLIAGIYGSGQTYTFSSATATTLTLSGTAWSTDQTNAACPTSRWIVVTSGTDAGDVQPVSSNTTSQITVQGWAITPDATSVFAMVLPEVTLYDSGATNYVTAGINARYLPATSQTDSGISIQLTDQFGVNPLFLGRNRTSLTVRDYTPLNPVLWCAGSDGETIGAVPFCGAGKAMLAAVVQIP